MKLQQTSFLGSDASNLCLLREVPGIRVSIEHLQMICCRYYTAGQFVQGKQVLEVGCGAGLGLGYLAKRAKRIVAGDYYEDAVRHAQEHYKGRVELLSLDAQALPFKDSCFDVVVAMEVMYYLSKPDRFLDECRRVLRSNGILVLCIINKDVPGFRGSPLAIRYFSTHELFGLLSRHHFDVEIFGAFPIPRGLIEQRVISVLKSMVAKVFNLFPKGREIKEFFKQLLSQNSNIILGEEIEAGMAENVELIRLGCDSPDFRYRFLYAIAYVQRS